MENKKIAKLNIKNRNFPESKKKRIKKLLVDSVLSSSIHGLPNILKTESIFLKIFWTFFLIISLSYCSYSIIKTFNSYFNWETVTNINVIQEIPTEYPAITICSLNIYSTEKAKILLNEIILKSGLQFNTINESYLNSLTIKYLFQMIAMSNNFSDENRREFAFPLSEFIIDCNFGLNKCSTDDFDWYYDLNYGNCYTFNNGRNFMGELKDIRNSNQEGSFNGLRLELFLGNQSDVPQLIFDSGVHVIVHNKSITPRRFEGIDVPSGMSTDIIISRSIVKKLKNPYSECEFDGNNPDQFYSEIYSVVLKTNKTYSQRECFSLCYQNYLIKECNCYMPFYNKLSGTNKCDDITEVICGMKFTTSFYKQDVNKKCSPYCPLECETITYSLSVSNTDFPNPKYAEFLKKQPIIQSKFRDSNYFTNNSNLGQNYTVKIDNDELKKSIAAIRIYYGDLKYTVVSQIPKMNFEDLLSNIGGQFGLFIGISFLSFIEILEIVSNIFFILFDRINNNIISQKQ